MIPRLMRWAAILQFVMLGWGVYMHQSGHFTRRELPNGLSAPVLAMELVRSDADVVQIVGEPNCTNDRAEMIHQQHLDFVFIAGYTIFLLLVCRLLIALDGRVTAFSVIAIA